VYTEVNWTIWKAVSEEVNIPASELNKYNISMQLQARGWEADTITLLRNILNECEMKLYTPDYNPENMQTMLQQADELIERLNRQ